MANTDAGSFGAGIGLFGRGSARCRISMRRAKALNGHEELMRSAALPR